ncbi:hypothetical protein BN2537_16411 [Streptomyces venezuelae]|nr:hypothetical protein BN2537_16411 [Streptomyces venezuelae]
MTPRTFARCGRSSPNSLDANPGPDANEWHLRLYRPDVDWAQIKARMGTRLPATASAWWRRF